MNKEDKTEKLIQNLQDVGENKEEVKEFSKVIIMNKHPIRKILIFIFITGVLIFIFSNILKSRKANDLIKYNEEFMNNYINNNLANCEIKEIKQYIFVPPVLEIDGF